MPTIDITGKIIKKFDTQVVSERFQKREFVLHVEEDRYPQEILLQLVQDKCDLLDSYKEGDQVLARVAIEGRSWQRSPSEPMRWFNSLKVFALQAAAGESSSPAFAPATTSSAPPPPPPPPPTSADDLPF